MSLLYATIRGYQGYVSGRVFTKSDHFVRHWTATIAHIQLLLGFTLYLKSPVVKAFFANLGDSINGVFFGVIHILLMLVTIVVLTIGSALAKRRSTYREKFGTMAMWFSVALLLIFVAIPWPFSPLANRPISEHFAYETLCNNECKLVAADWSVRRHFAASVDWHCRSGQCLCAGEPHLAFSDNRGAL